MTSSGAGEGTPLGELHRFLYLVSIASSIRDAVASVITPISMRRLPSVGMGSFRTHSARSSLLT